MIRHYALPLPPDAGGVIEIPQLEVPYRILMARTQINNISGSPVMPTLRVMFANLCSVDFCPPQVGLQNVNSTFTTIWGRGLTTFGGLTDAGLGALDQRYLISMPDIIYDSQWKLSLLNQATVVGDTWNTADIWLEELL